MKHQGLQRSAVIDIQGLTALWDFGWLRPQELGRLLWPEATHQVKYAERIARRWSEKGLVLSRKLPAHNGTAMVLSESGARLLRESIGVAAQSGKDWGETRNGAWMAPRWWRHDLIANSLLSILAASGHHVIPERKLRRENRSAKIPDGLAISPDGKDIFWIEIESARKSGRPMREMAHYMTRVATGKAPTLSGIKANKVLVGYVKDIVDERGYRLDHRARTLGAIRAMAPADLKVTTCELSLKGAAVASFRNHEFTIASDMVSCRVREWDHLWHEAPENEDATTCTWGSLVFSYWEEETNCWGWQVVDPHQLGPDGYPKNVASSNATSAEGARRALAEVSLE